MSYIEQIDSFAEKLSNDSDLSSKHAVLVELCDIIESFLGTREYEYFLDTLLPVFEQILNEVPVSFVTSEPENKLRNSVFEAYNRLTLNETFRSHADSVVTLMGQKLKEENEENGIMCIKIINNLHKVYKEDLASHVDAFFATIYELYGNSNTMIATLNNSCSQITNSSDDLATDTHKRLLPSAMNSFKTLSECPITMVSILSSYKQLVTKVLVEFIPKIISLLQLEVDAQKNARAAAEAKGLVFTSVAPEIKNRQLYSDFIVSQVKATSFLAYMFIRGHSPEFMAKYHDVIPYLIVRVLQDCPSELSAAKKELLHATRHILSTPQRTIFIPKIELLFNENVLLGTGLTCSVTLRPLAYSTIADFVHNVRKELTNDQLWKAVQMFTRILKDKDLNPNVAVMCGKLLVNLLERVEKLPKQENRRLTMLIVETIAIKFEQLNRKFSLIASVQQKAENDKEKNSNDEMTVKCANSKLPETYLLQDVPILTPERDAELDLETIIKKESGALGSDIELEKMYVDVEEDQNKSEDPEVFDLEKENPVQINRITSNDPLKDCKQLVKGLSGYLKSLMLFLRFSNPAAPQEFKQQAWEAVAREFSSEEVDVLRSLFKEGVSCIKHLANERLTVELKKKFTFDVKASNIPITASKEEKEVMELFSTSFMKLDPAVFNEILSRELPFLVSEMVTNPSLLHIPHFFLSNESISANFMGVLVDYLSSRLDQLGDLPPMEAHILLRLFKLFLLSLNLYPQQNEHVLLPHLNDLILRCFELATTTKEPVIYLYFVKILFKSIGGGRFEKLYKEVMPLMQKTLENLNRLIDCAASEQERDLCIELCLSIPVRLNKLVSMLHYLMKPLLLALNGSSDLVSQGLRTLELCIDNLNANYFDPIIEPVITDVSKALWKHLRPLPYYYVHSHTAVRILGKLGGRNRNFIKPPIDLSPESVESVLNVKATLKVIGMSENVAISVTTGVQAAVNILRNPRLSSRLGVHYRINAFHYVASILKLFLNTGPLDEKKHCEAIKIAKELLEDTREAHVKPLVGTNIGNMRKFTNQELLVESLLKAVFESITVEEVSKEVKDLVMNLCDYFAQLFIIKSVVRKYKKTRQFNVLHNEGRVFLDFDILSHVITFSMSSSEPKIVQLGTQAIQRVTYACTVMFGSHEAGLRLGMQSSLVVYFIHSCYDENHFNKLGGVQGLAVLIRDAEIPIAWFKQFQHELIRALFFVLRDSPSVVPAKVTNVAHDLILEILSGCNENVTKFDELPNEIMSSLVYDLASSNKKVRTTCKEALETLSKNTGLAQLDLLLPCKSILLNPIFGKPLRALPFLMQISHIEAITYWLSLCQEKEFFTETQRLLLEVVSLVEAEDSMLTSSIRLIDHETREQLTELRVVCLKLLTVALDKQEYISQESGLTRLRVLAIFFKTLASTETAIVDAAHEGLKNALKQNNKLPKDLLQSGLRPMLMNLSDYRKLSVNNLKTLARLLVVLSNYFKVEIGRKLLDHLNSWASSALLHQVAGLDLDNQNSVQIIVHIYKIFELLPNKAYIFFEDVMVSLERAESNLRRVQGSPFREAIVGYVSKYAAEAWKYFEVNFAKSQKTAELLTFFISKSPELRKVVEEHLTTSVLSKAIDVLGYINVVSVICATKNAGDLTDSDTIVKLLQVGCSHYAKTSQNLNTPLYLELSHSFVKIQLLLVKFLEQNHDFKLLLTIMDNCARSHVPISPQFNDYIMNKIAKSKDNELRQKCLDVTITMAIDQSTALATKEELLKQIVNPILLVEKSRSGNVTNVFHESWFKKLHSGVWNSSVLDFSSGETDFCRLELLKTTAIMILCAKEETLKVKKDVVKFSWALMKLDDTLTKYAAYLVTCYFFATFDSPEKVVSKVLFALLRASNMDARPLVQQSLSVLAPVIPKLGDLWIQWPRRVISEQGMSINNTFVVYKFMVEHEELFWEYRDQFVTSVIAAMGKLTIAANSGQDNQLLAIEIAEMVLKWEQRRAASSELAVSEIPSGQKKAFVTFLIRFLCISSHKITLNPVLLRGLNVLFVILAPDVWPDTFVDLNFFEKFFAQSGPSSHIYCVNALEVLATVLEHKDLEWIYNNLQLLQSLLESCIKSTNHDIQEALQRVLRIMLRSLDKGEDSASAKSLSKLLVQVITQDLSETSALSAGISLLWTVANYKPKLLDSLIAQIIRTFAKLCKDYMLITTKKSETTSDDEARMTAGLLRKILKFSILRIDNFGENRRMFLSFLAQFLERVDDKELLKDIVDVVHKWIFVSDSQFPTQKEKAAILAKLVTFENRRSVAPQFSKDHLKMILKVFEDDSNKTSELVPRLEHSFLVGTRYHDVGLRQRFMQILSNSLPKDVQSRIWYVIRDQNWEDLADFPWLILVLEILFASFESSEVELTDGEYTFPPVTYLQELTECSDEKDSEELGDQNANDLESFVKNHAKFLSSTSVDSVKILSFLTEVLRGDTSAVSMTFVQVFPVIFKSIEKSQVPQFNLALTSLLSKEYHNKAGNKFDGISAILAAANKCPNVTLAPHLVKYVGQNYNAYFPAIEMLEKAGLDAPKQKLLLMQNEAPENSAALDALLEMYLVLDEKDSYYGLWRRRAKYSLTNSALSFEQIGMCEMAMRYYENAQIKARTGNLPFSESEYSLWENAWISCAEKLQHWDVLTELSKHENYTYLLLECGWRVANWNEDREPLDQSVKTVSDVASARRHIFQTFLCLQEFAQSKRNVKDVVKLCDEGIQLSLRKWASLPKRFVPVHATVLHQFQQFVEFSEAAQIYGSLMSTNAQNIESKSAELKRVLTAWRERLPNTWEDVNLWNDLVVWRQHFFQLVNNIYIPFLQNVKGGNTYSQVYCGYHEIACVINRFSHVARKHGLDDVCIQQLNQIYNLPNIEIMEAFVKLIEQVKCYYHNDKELINGLDVISNTNLAYFGTKQKAEFFVLKGMFLAKLSYDDKASQAFATAVQLDSNLAKAWAKWGLFHYKKFNTKKSENKDDNMNPQQQHENDIENAKNALICFLHAVGLYKSAKSRRYLALILWVISLDDDSGTLAKELHAYKGEIPVWYWITFIPQLLTSLSHREAKFVRNVLILIAKTYPQALHFPLRTTKEDFLAIQKQIGGSKASELDGGNSTSTAHPWDYVEEIMNISKTAYPLLALSLESLVAQITQRFKSNSDEDAYRLIAALYNDGMQSFNRMLNPRNDGKLPVHMVQNLTRFAETVLSKEVKVEFEKDFIKSSPTYETYIRKLIQWKERFENKLDRRYNKIHLEHLSPHLTEFHHQKFEDIEVPGQYLLNKDSNMHFVKIERFLPILEVVRGYSACYKRLRIRGKDGSMHQFSVQFPSNRHSRREERIFQLFRIFEGGIVRNVQCRSRNLSLSLPVAVALSPHIRIMSNDTNDITLQEVYEQICRSRGQKIEEPFFYIVEKLKATFDPRLPKPDIVSTMTEIFSAVQTLYVPSGLVKDFFVGLYPEYEDFWFFRKQFTSQYACFILMTYMMSITSRQPQKININVSSGNVWTSEMLPTKTIQKRNESEERIPAFSNPEAVPFRLTPNIQELIGPVGLEGILSVHFLLLARCLANPEFDIENFLSLFVRDEVISWFAQNLQSSAQGPHLREIVRANVEFIIERIQRVGHVSNNVQITTQYVNELIAVAVNPRNLAQLDYLWRPYL